MAQTARSTQDELTSRHRAALMTVAVMFILTLLLMALALSGVFPNTQSRNPALAGTLRIVVAFFVLGAIALRRTKFSAMRLRDIASLRGTAGLFDTLQKTTIYVALIGGAIALMGFVINLMTGNVKDMLGFGIIALIVLLYAYPRRAAWESVLKSAQQPDTAGTSTAKGDDG
ncbi:MAG: hypothetical protein LC754_14585 [Acidobacteria bacterium]|nr:hypothetical protein [Acidobacteriota bacterium]